jgi:hypothetical protein
MIGKMRTLRPPHSCADWILEYIAETSFATHEHMTLLPVAETDLEKLFLAPSEANRASLPSWLDFEIALPTASSAVRSPARTASADARRQAAAPPNRFFQV